MSLPNDYGIYIIRNLITGKCYICQSVSICRRVLRHKCDLNNNMLVNNPLYPPFFLRVMTGVAASPPPLRYTVAPLKYREPLRIKLNFYAA